MDETKQDNPNGWTTLCTSSGCCPQARFGHDDDGNLISVEIKDDFGGSVILNSENCAILVSLAARKKG